MRYQTLRVPPAAWDGSSVWDLPIDSMAQAPTIEQMQQIEKAKAAKVSALCATVPWFLIGFFFLLLVG